MYEITVTQRDGDSFTVNTFYQESVLGIVNIFLEQATNDSMAGLTIIRSDNTGEN